MSTDETIQKHVTNGKAQFVKGDALVEEDVRLGWTKAATYGNVDAVLFTVGEDILFLSLPQFTLPLGGTPKFHLTKGFLIDPENLVTQALLNVLCTIPQDAPHPRIVVISSIGMTKKSHAALPFLLKPLYSHFLALPHKDKVGAERAISHCAGWEWSNKNDGDPGEKIMGTAWLQRPNLPSPGSLSKDVLVIRPGLFTDGDCKTRSDGTPAYRVSEQELTGWTVSRKDVAHFITDAILNRWDEFAGKRINIVY